MKNKFHTIRYIGYIRPKIFLCMGLVFLISSCAVFRKPVKENSKNKKSNSTENQQDKKKIKTVCYCPSF